MSQKTCCAQSIKNRDQCMFNFISYLKRFLDPPPHGESHWPQDFQVAQSGHSWMLQRSSFSCSSSPRHPSSPISPLRHSRLRDWKPPPHFLLQYVYSLHLDHVWKISLSFSWSCLQACYNFQTIITNDSEYTKYPKLNSYRRITHPLWKSYRRDVITMSHHIDYES